MEDEQEARYCTYHGYEEYVFPDQDGFLFHNHMIADDEAIECYGPFTFCPPPPPFTEEEWETILEEEYYRYAS